MSLSTSPENSSSINRVKDIGLNSAVMASINGKFLRNSWSVSSFGSTTSTTPQQGQSNEGLVSKGMLHKIKDSPFRPPRHSSTSRIRTESLRRSMSWQSLSQSQDDLIDKVSVSSSIEDDTVGLHNKIEHLKEHLELLMEKQVVMDKRYNKVKDDNNNLVARVHILEEQVNEVRNRGKERLEEERKRNKEEVQRLKREMMIEMDNYSIRSEGLEKIKDSLENEVSNLKSQLEKSREKSFKIENNLSETQLLLLKELKGKENRALQVETSETEIVINSEGENEKWTSSRNRMSQNDSGMLVSDEVFGDHPINARIEELEMENRVLKEKYEELQTKLLSRDFNEGKSLLSLSSKGQKSSIADEFESMSQENMKRKMHEQRSLIRQLNNYIDNVLLRIMERDPQILERN